MKDISAQDLIVSFEMVGKPNTTDNSKAFHHIKVELRERTKYIGSVALIRIPSSRNPTHQCVTTFPYDMADAMEQFGADTAQIANEMQLQDRFTCSGCRKHLHSNDLYFVHKLYIVDEYRHQGFGTYMLNNLSDWIRNLTREYNPVFVTIPRNYRLDFTNEQKQQELLGITQFFSKCGWLPVGSDTKTMYKPCSE